MDPSKPNNSSTVSNAWVIDMRFLLLSKFFQRRSRASRDKADAELFRADWEKSERVTPHLMGAVRV